MKFQDSNQGEYCLNYLAKKDINIEDISVKLFMRLKAYDIKYLIKFSILLLMILNLIPLSLVNLILIKINLKNKFSTTNIFLW